MERTCTRRPSFSVPGNTTTNSTGSTGRLPTWRARRPAISARRRENAESGLIQNVYYWESEAALQQLMQHPAHLEAKTKQARWLDGYRVVISKVLREYGDGKLTQPHAGQSA